MPTSPEDPSPAGHEPLACVACRSRKLKCDRLKPKCARCAKAGTECQYPESRRKPAFKRRNVRELEERLAQVEGMLKNVGKQPLRPAAPAASSSSASASAFVPNASVPLTHQDPAPADPDGERSSYGFHGFFSDLGVGGSGDAGSSSFWGSHTPTESQPSRKRDPPEPGRELLALGQFESLPPFEMIEELHRTFFAGNRHFLPIVHEGNYLRAFHSPPHMRPPLCLQYAIWAHASNFHKKYRMYHSALYLRARQYLEADELKGFGESFISVAHAQAWAIIATDEAQSLLFTRAAMSSARCARLVGVMGLHRLDDPLPGQHLIPPVLLPPKNWTELEERRRAFWGAFCIDSYASISAGWPQLVDVSLITTRLPASDAAFAKGEEEETPTLHNVFSSSNYSTFAGNIIICHLFNQVMKHTHRPGPDDYPENYERGRYWDRHRLLDNTLSSVFMFLPERYRLPMNILDPVAVHFNLNLHAAVISLHKAASEKAEKHKLPGNIKRMSQERALTAAKEIVEIVKIVGNTKTAYATPLMALPLYFACVVFLARAKENPDECDDVSLEILIKTLVVLGHHHTLARGYFNQVLLDIQRNNIRTSIDLAQFRGVDTSGGHDIPLMARSSVSEHSRLPPPLPGRLPLGSPVDSPANTPSPAVNAPAPGLCSPFIEGTGILGDYADLTVREGPASKRQRTAEDTYPVPGSTGSASGIAGAGEPGGYAAGDPITVPGRWAGMVAMAMQLNLPHRTGSPMTGVSSTSRPSAPDPGPSGMSLHDEPMEYSAPGVRGEAAAAFFPQHLQSSHSVPQPYPRGEAAATTQHTAGAGHSADQPDFPDMGFLQDFGNPESFISFLSDVLASDGNHPATREDNPWDTMNDDNDGTTGGESWNSGMG